MFKKPSLLQHEIYCISNPKRQCYLCQDGIQVENFTELSKEFLSRNDVTSNEDYHGNELNTFFTKSQIAIDWLDKKCGNCPACMLAILKQSKVLAYDIFDYKERMLQYRKEQTREHWAGGAL